MMNCYCGCDREAVTTYKGKEVCQECANMANKNVKFIMRVLEGKTLKINDLVQEAHDNAVNKGFWDKPRETGTLLALIHSEVSEALEADRKGDRDNLAEEMADIVIRVADFCGGKDIDLEYAIIQKMDRNRNRERLHGKRY